MPPRQHSLMQHPDDLDDPRALRAIENHMNGVTDWSLTTVVAAVADVIAAQAGKQIAAIDTYGYSRADCNAPQRRRQQCAIAQARVGAVHGFTGAQDRRNIRLRRFGKAVARHGSPRRRGEVVQSGIEIGVTHLGETSVFQRVEPGL